jgi:hypothetical protein
MLETLKCSNLDTSKNRLKVPGKLKKCAGEDWSSSVGMVVGEMKKYCSESKRK